MIKKFEEKLKELDNYYELKKLLYYLLFLMNFLQGKNKTLCFTS
ncbi:MAG: hypothetical protein ABGW69_00580 [Nanoarchaeota archaeon]